MRVARELEQRRVFAQEQPGVFVVKIADLLGGGRVRVLLKIIPEGDLAGKGLKILLGDPHARVVEITARKQNVDLMLVEAFELVADQEIAELDHGDRVELGMIRIFGE